MTDPQADTVQNTYSTNLAVATTSTNPPTEQAVYNRVAMALGEKIHQAKAKQQTPVDGHLRRVTESGDAPFYDPSRQVSSLQMIVMS